MLAVAGLPPPPLLRVVVGTSPDPGGVGALVDGTGPDDDFDFVDVVPTPHAATSTVSAKPESTAGANLDRELPARKAREGW